LIVTPENPPERHFVIQVGDTLRRPKSIASHGFQRFAITFNRTAVIHGPRCGGRGTGVSEHCAEQRAKAVCRLHARLKRSPANTLADGAPVENTRLQVDCFYTTYAAAVTLAVAVKAAMTSSAITHLLLLEQDQFEPEALLHRVILDFSIWH